MEIQNVLVIGGNSYVGHFLVPELCKKHLVACTTSHPNHSEQASDELTFRKSGDTPLSPSSIRNLHYKLYQMDLTNKESIEECIIHFEPDVIVNLGAISSPSQCETHPLADKINCPIALLEVIEDVCPDCLLIQFSSDHVYDGESTTKYSACYPTNPINAYGKSKTKFDEAIRMRIRRHFILRSSVIYGPECPRKGTILQFIEKNLRETILVEGLEGTPHKGAAGSYEPERGGTGFHKPGWEIRRRPDCRGWELQAEGQPLPVATNDCEFINGVWTIEELLVSMKTFLLFSDETRNFVYIKDVVQIVCRLVEKNKPNITRIFCMGGPDSLTRAEFGKKCLLGRGISTEFISCKRRCEVNEPWAKACKQPKNLSMDHSELEDFVGYKTLSLDEVLELPNTPFMPNEPAKRRTKLSE